MGTDPDRMGPANGQDLIYKLWNSLNWGRTFQLVTITLALGLTVALIFGGLGLLAYLTIGTSPWFSAALAAVSGGGASGSTYVYFQMRRGKPRGGPPNPPTCGDAGGSPDSRPL